MSPKTAASRTRRQGAIYLEPDSLPVVLPAIAGALTVGGVSFLMSWDALRTVGLWAGVAPSRTWGLPLAIDSSILVFSALWLIARRRGAPTWFHILAVTAFTLGSVGGNVAHALAAGAGQGWQIGVGAVAAAAFPLTVFATTHAVAGLLVDPDADVKPVRARRASRAARRVAQQAAQAAPTPTLEPAAATVAQAHEPHNQRQSANVPGRDGSERPRRVYTPEQREQALALAAQGLSQRQIAEQVDASKSAVQAWLAAGVGAAA